jgi:UDP-galactopyranose mutase
MSREHYNFVIVGSGFYGTVAAERLHKAGKSVLVIEKRPHIGGNCYSYQYENTDIIVHKYGTHIFHTSSNAVWDYITRFTEFNRYQHRVLTTYKGKVYTMPINLGTINSFYNVNLRPSQVDIFLATKKSDVRNPKNLQEKAISLIGEELYDAFIKGYTQKQWNCDPRDLPPDIIARLPVRTSYYDSYFNDVYQGLPKEGYAPVFEKMLKGIPVLLNVDLLEDREYWLRKCDILVYTGPIDKYFEYKLGKLNWRSVRFESELLPLDDFQGTSVMNYADIDIPYTRIHEPKHLHPEKHNSTTTTVIIKEYSCTNDEEPYYPINFEEDQRLCEDYQKLASKEKSVFFGGRLAEYKYYDMDKVIANALADAKQLINRQEGGKS